MIMLDLPISCSYHVLIVKDIPNFKDMEAHAYTAIHKRNQKSW